MNFLKNMKINKKLHKTTIVALQENTKNYKQLERRVIK